MRIRQTVDELYRTHSSAVRAKLRRLGIHGAELDELHQDTFLVALRLAEDLPANARAWLCEVARKLAANHRRRHRHAFEVLDGDAMAELPAPMELVDLLRRELEGLPRADLELILRHGINGETVAELGHDLGLSPTAVYVRLRAARDRLRHDG